MQDVIVNISDTLQPVKRAEFNRALILGDTDVSQGVLKDTYRVYESIEDVAQDFPEGTPEYQCALRIFAQIPRPKDVAIYSVTRSDPADPDRTAHFQRDT